MKLSICIPTFNRENELINLLKTIEECKSNNFEVIIIDDGSTDRTHEKVMKFKSQSSKIIRYYYQKNQGKMSAFRYAINLSRGQYIADFDSDDEVIHDGLDNFLKGKYDKKLNDNKVIGISFKCVDSKNKVIGAKYVKDHLSKYSYIHYVLNIRGDKKDLIKSDQYKRLIKEKKPFDIYMPKIVYLMEFDKKFDFIFTNDQIAKKNYLQSGISNNIFKHIRQNPVGYFLLSATIIKLNYKTYKYIYHFQKVRAYINFSRYWLFSFLKISDYSFLPKFNILNITLISIFLPIGIIFFIFDRCKMIMSK